MQVIIFDAVSFLFEAYSWAILIYIIASWIPSIRNNVIVQFCAKIVEPYFSIFRRFIPPIGVFDLSSLVAIIVFHQFIRVYALEGLSYLLNLI